MSENQLHLSNFKPQVNTKRSHYAKVTLIIMSLFSVSTLLSHMIVSVNLNSLLTDGIHFESTCWNIMMYLYLKINSTIAYNTWAQNKPLSKCVPNVYNLLPIFFSFLNLMEIWNVLEYCYPFTNGAYLPRL